MADFVCRFFTSHIVQHKILVKHGNLLLKNVYHQKITSHLDSVKYFFMEGMISGDLLRTYSLSECSAYFSPSSKFSSIPITRFSLSSILINKSKTQLDVNEYTWKNNIKSKIWRVYIPHFWICEQISTQLEETHGNSCTSGYKYGIGLESQMSINIINFFHLKSDCNSLIVLLHMFASVQKYIFQPNNFRKHTSWRLVIYWTGYAW